MSVAHRPAPNIYDQVPYPSLSFTKTHPDHLATIATLLNMQPPPVARCRVLELGCAGGGNLIPMALSMPDSQFVGVDSSARQIAGATAAVEALGLKNIRFKAVDILEVDEGLGRFDYIIAHGVYSWVPPEVQNKLLQICRQNLAPNGVAYVSYNVYPGWHLLGAVRDMMLCHTRHLTDPAERAAQARALLDFLTRGQPAKDNPYATFLNRYLEFFKENLVPKTDEFLLHDELSEINEPIYFYQFAERAANHGLRYLGDANFQNMLASNLPAKVSDAIRRMANDTISVEQYMDFWRNQSFRKTLLCHENVRLKSKLTPEELAKFYVASSALPASPEVDIYDTSVVRFLGPDGAALSTDHPVTKAAMLHLSEVWPRPVAFNDLLQAARARLNGTSTPADSPGSTGDVEMLAVNLMRAFSYSENLLELHVYLPNFVLEVSSRPVASPVARYQARQGIVVTNLRHERVHLNPICYNLLPHLDGRHSHADLLAVLARLVEDGVVKLTTKDESKKESAKQVDSSPPAVLDAELVRLANAALLVG